MMYKLERKSNGQVIQRSADGTEGNIYDKRKKLNKIALKNLRRNTPEGKLGKLSDLQIFNFNIANFSSSTNNYFFEEFNTSATGSTACDDAIMFTDGKSGDGIYYNVLDVKINLRRDAKVEALQDSYIEFFLLQNSASPIGKKIPRTESLFSSASGTINFSTTGANQGNQYFTSTIGVDTPIIPINSKGLRTSGLALKTIYLNFDASEDMSAMELDVILFVDNSSASRSF
jgi:hypothetical protein